MAGALATVWFWQRFLTERQDVTSQFGTVVRQLRQRAELTQEELAERSGLGVRTVRGLETGERADPRVGTVRRLADALALDETERLDLFAAAGFPGPAPVLAPPEPPRPVSAVDERLTAAAGELAHAIRARWQREEEQRQIHDPFPLPVRWQPMPEELTDSWANIRRSRAGGPTDPLDLTGQLDHIVEVYRRIPSGRLVVLGQAGSGKTILTLRFVLDLLRDRADDDPVPVIFGLGSWHPTTVTLRDWLIAQLQRDHPSLGAPGPNGTTLAAALVETGRVLPVLDGFDEIAEGLHRAALEALNATSLPLLVTSRPDEYTEAVSRADVLTAAGGVALVDLTPTDLADYLPRTTRRTGDAGTAWQPVLTALNDHPAGANLAAVLTTPLMVGLARTIYSDTPDHDPADLLDTDRFPTKAAIEDHLLGNFVPTVYRDRPGAQRFPPDRVQHWLGYLARHLARLGTYDLAWWQLGMSMRLPVRMLVVALTAGFVLGPVDILIEGIVTGEITTSMFVLGVMLSGVIGAAIGLAYGLVNRSRPAGPEPVRVSLRLTRAARPPGLIRSRFRIGFVAGLALGCGYAVIREAARWLVFGVGEGLTVAAMDAVLFGLIFGVLTGTLVAFIARCETPLDVTSAGSPTDLLRANRRTVLIQLAVFGPTFAITVPLAFWGVIALLRQLEVGTVLGIEFLWSPLAGLLLGLVGGIVGATGYLLSLSAWGQWLVFTRLCLPLTGRLPWSVRDFLDDAYNRGVLRRAGAVYQFRHARLQDHLATIR